VSFLSKVSGFFAIAELIHSKLVPRHVSRCRTKLVQVVLDKDCKLVDDVERVKRGDPESESNTFWRFELYEGEGETASRKPNYQAIICAAIVKDHAGRWVPWKPGRPVVSSSLLRKFTFTECSNHSCGRCVRSSPLTTFSGYPPQVIHTKRFLRFRVSRTSIDPPSRARRVQFS